VGQGRPLIFLKEPTAALLAPPELRDVTLGCRAEQFARDARRFGRKHAVALYWCDVLKSIGHIVRNPDNRNLGAAPSRQGLPVRRLGAIQESNDSESSRNLGPVGLHWRASFCASAICAGVIFAATISRAFAASFSPLTAKLSHMCART
jgi:hypothetical protein